MDRILTHRDARAPRTRRPLLHSFLVAVLTTAAAGVLRWLLWPALGDTSPFLAFVPAVMFSAWYGGLAPGLLATALGALAGAYYLLAPVSSLQVAGTADVVRLTLFLLIGLQTSWLNEALHGERERAERSAQALRQSEDRFRLLLEGVQDYSIVMLDEAGRLASWNGGAERIYGYREEEILGRHFSCLHPDDETSDQVQLRSLTAAEREGRWEEQGWHARRDGTRFWADTILTPLPVGPGRSRGFVMVTRDLTERKETERREAVHHAITQVLAEAASVEAAAPRLLEAIGETAGWDFGAFWSVDRQARVLSCVTTWAREGVPLEEFEKATRASVFALGVGLPGRVWANGHAVGVTDVIVDANFPRAPAAAAVGLHGAFAFPVLLGSDVLGVLEFFSRELREPDEALLAMATGAGSQIGQFVERKRVEDEARESEAHKTTILEESEERLRFALTAGNLGTWEWNLQTGEVQWSDCLATIHGLTPGTSGGTFQAYLGEVHPEDRERVAEVVRASVEEGKPHEIEYRLRRPDGTIRWIMGRGRVVHDETGKPVRVIGICMDITERKEAEEEIRRLNETLERRVVERTAQLQEANKELESFSYSVSHDLRAPLRHISGFADMLQKRAASALDESGRRYLRTIVESARHAGTLVDDLLAFSRMGRAEMRETRVAMDRLVQEVRREVEPEAEGRNIDWRIGELPEVRADPAMLRLVWRNLIANAVKYTRPRETAVIEIGSASREEETVFYVRDNGVGFDMRYVEKLFGVFQRLHSADEFEGTGIGLANVRRIIHRHGGRTWAESAVGEGATFYFSLPKIGDEHGGTETDPPGGR